jgi:hypothetical protein
MISPGKRSRLFEALSVCSESPLSPVGLIRSCTEWGRETARTEFIHAFGIPNTPARPSCVGLVVQILFRDLADWSLWQCVADLESLHHFVLAELVLQKFLELVERELCRTVL